MKQKAWKFPAKCRIQPIQGWQKQGLAPEILRQPPTSRSYEIGKTRFAFLLEMVMFIHHEFFFMFGMFGMFGMFVMFGIGKFGMFGMFGLGENSGNPKLLDPWDPWLSEKEDPKKQRQFRIQDGILIQIPTQLSLSLYIYIIYNVKLGLIIPAVLINPLCAPQKM